MVLFWLLFPTHIFSHVQAGKIVQKMQQDANMYLGLVQRHATSQHVEEWCQQRVLRS